MFQDIQSHARTDRYLSLIRALTPVLLSAGLALGCSGQLGDGSQIAGGGSTAQGGPQCAGEACPTSCGTHDDCGVGQFCSSGNSCAVRCATCGAACTTTADCPAGQYCTGGSCEQECTPGPAPAAGCSGGLCTSDGRCQSPDDNNLLIDNTGGAGGMGGAGGAGNEECIDVDVTFEPQIPNVVLLIDQSGSMKAANFGSAVDDAIAAGTYAAWDCGDDYDWRWNVVRNVLLHPTSGVVKPLEEKVRFGLSLYSSDKGDSGGTCPMLTNVTLDFGTHSTMLQSFECSDLIDDTPTRESLNDTAQQLHALQLEGPKVIVLATDGLPDNCSCYDWNSEAGSDCLDSNTVQRGGVDMSPRRAEQYDVVEEARRIHDDLGITVEVINVSDPDSNALADHLDEVAARGGAASGASIDGFDPGSLTAAFQAIIDGVRSCAVDLDGEISEGKEATGTVTLDGTALLLDDPNGWKVNSPTQIELLGVACDTIKSGDHELDISFPCNAFVPSAIR